MKVLVTDTETTGLDENECKLIEIAACTYDTETQMILESYQSLLYAEENAAQEVNNIPPEALKKMPQGHLEDAKDTLLALAENADYVMAHNAEFDRKFYEANGVTFEVPWVCSKKDLNYPGDHKSMRLGHLCYDFDIPVLKAHSALHDCYILIELLKKLPDLEEQLNVSQEPKTTYMAKVSFQEKDKAKKAGFSWDKSKKMWLKDLRDSEVKKLQEEGEFEIHEVEG